MIVNCISLLSPTYFFDSLNCISLILLVSFLLLRKDADCPHLHCHNPCTNWCQYISLILPSIFLSFFQVYFSQIPIVSKRWEDIVHLLYCYTCHPPCTTHCDNRPKTFCRLFQPQILFAIILLPDEKCDRCSTCDTRYCEAKKICRYFWQDISDNVILCVKTLQRPTSLDTNRSRPIQARWHKVNLILES